MDSRIERAVSCLKKAGLLIDLGGDWDTLSETCSLKSDSRMVRPGDIFACVCGLHFDGHDFIDKVMKGGASGLIVQRPVRGLPVSWIQVEDVRAAMGYVAAELEDEPAQKLKMCAVTGTNGKSTTSCMIRSILNACGLKCGLLGTIVYDNGAQAVLADRTTPESSQVQEFLSEMVKNGCAACSMECSSHGLVQGRLSGCLFDGAVFTNLSPEHLDFHGDMEGYFSAKARLFRNYLKPDAVLSVNAQSPYGRRLIEEFPQAVSWALDGEARLRARSAEFSLDGSEFDLTFDGKFMGRAHIPLSGRFNVENALGAAALCLGMGCEESKVLEGLRDIPQVPGRMERLNLENGVRVIIDYAHTAEALRVLLGTLRPLVQGRLVSLFGHGGDRFAGHRPLLGAAAAEFADKIFLTMDNPRTEDPLKIAGEIAEGIRSARQDDCFSIVMPREAAIKAALDWCEPGDLLVLSGKGPEPYLEINGVKHPYSDKGAVENWMAEKGVRAL